MSRPLLILRPEPGAQASAARARETGLEPLVHPLFAIEPVAWDAPEAATFDAVMFTSANALRHGGAALARYVALPAYAVGEGTARAARAAGFAQVQLAGPDGAATLRAMAAAGVRHVLHIGGAEVRAHDPGALKVERRVVYRSVGQGSAESLAPLLARQPVALLHSPRAGQRLAMLAPQDARGKVALVGISPAALAAAGEGWEQSDCPAQPDDAAMLAIALRICQ